jgi:hypothetical protein
MTIAKPFQQEEQKNAGLVLPAPSANIFNQLRGAISII